MFGFTNAQQKNKNYSNIMKSESIYEIDAFLKDAHPDDPRRSILKPRLMNLLKEYIKTAHPADQRVKEMQEKLALLKTRSSTKIGYEEMNAKIKQKQIQYYQEELNRINSGYYARMQKVNKAETIPVAKELEESQSKSTAATTKPASTAVPKTSTAAPSRPAATTSASAAAPTVAVISASATTEASEKAEFDLLMNPSVGEHKSQTVKILNALFDNDPNSKETTVMIKNSSDCNIIVRMEGAGNSKYRLAVPAKGENTIVIAKGPYLFSSIVCGATYASQKTVQKAIMVSLGNPK